MYSRSFEFPAVTFSKFTGIPGHPTLYQDGSVAARILHHDGRLEFRIFTKRIEFDAARMRVLPQHKISAMKKKKQANCIVRLEDMCRYMFDQCAIQLDTTRWRKVKGKKAMELVKTWKAVQDIRFITVKEAVLQQTAEHYRKKGLTPKEAVCIGA